MNRFRNAFCLAGICLGIFLAGCSALPCGAQDLGAQSPVMIVAPNYTNSYTTAGGHQSMPGSSVYLTPDGYPVARTPRGEWIYMINPEAVRLPQPSITVISGMAPMMPVGMPGMMVPGQGMMMPATAPAARVMPPVAPGTPVQPYATGYGGFIVPPQQ